MQFGIKDEEFIRGKVPMTKAEIRAMVMVKAAIQPAISWLTSVQGQALYPSRQRSAAPKGAVYSIERNPEGIELIRKNAEKFGCRNIHTIAGTAPEAMEGLPKMDVIIIGGSSGNMHEILDHVKRCSLRADASSLPLSPWKRRVKW